ncbi:hypothetical protein [Haloferax sp. Atlit-6N]|uniref:hypothetical protein n=1 Tax=Haloferax sp. Atlit-6N TaxID=2077205 RepID=UPI0018F4D85A|nr:hypothetical protein [Haloferax sp. Atlit-6N]
MSRDDGTIHTASEDSPILTAYEPDFQRVFARGSLLRVDQDDPDIVQLGFWSTKDEGVPTEEEDQIGTGYRLETEVMMTWRSAVNLHNLLENYLDQNLPERHQDLLESSD